MKQKKIYITLLIGTICSIGIVTLLFAFSEDMIHRQKDVFIRRYPHHPANQKHALDLGYNSYYIAGVENGKIYLGNHTAPLHMVVLDSTLKDTQHIKIRLDQMDFPFKTLQVKVDPPNFYMMDGTVPAVFKGKTSDWKASLAMNGKAYFSWAEPIDTNTLIIRARSAATGENELGMVTLEDSTKAKLFPDLLQKQIDGVFCTDGMLLFEKESRKMVYVYYYRNQFVVVDTDLRQEFIGKTIDTISKAQIDVGTINSKNANTLASRSLLVNRQSSVYKNYLFVNSNMLGKYESEKMLDQARIIDVYDLKKNTYEFSFYLYDYLQNKMGSFQVHGNLLIAIADQYIVTHTLKQDRFEDMKITEDLTKIKN